MSSEGLFDGETFSLCHTDLMPRNIMVGLDREGDDILTGVLDWDEAAFSPGFASCVPPYWLWAPSKYFVPGGDPVESLETNLSAPETPELALVKKAFDAEAGDYFVSRAYSPEFIIARGLLRSLEIQKWRAHEWNSRARLICEWRRLR